MSVEKDVALPIAIFAALRLELAELERGMALLEQRKQGNCRLVRARHGGAEVLLAQTGPGRDNAQRAARLVLDEYRPRIALAVGLAGALKGDLEGGELVVCEEAYRLGGGADLSPPLQCDEGLVELASKALRRGGLAARVGNSLTVDDAYSAPSLKERLASLAPAEVVEMENYWLAQEMERQGTPFLGVRAISDPLDQSLAEGVTFVDQTGEARTVKVALHALRHPSDVILLLRLSLNVRRSAANLTAFVAAFLELLEQAARRGDDVCGQTQAALPATEEERL